MAFSGCNLSTANLLKMYVHTVDMHKKPFLLHIKQQETLAVRSP